jgi:hypothetical protein
MISMGSLFNYSFFITQKKMKTQLREGPVYGTLPILTSNLVVWLSKDEGFPVLLVETKAVATLYQSDFTTAGKRLA